MTHRYTPRPFSVCCHARVVGQVCSECGKAAPWRTRLTEEDVARVTARLAQPVVRYTPEQQAAGRRVLYPLEND